MKKGLQILVFFYILQFILSCGTERCNEDKHYYVYTNIEIQFYDTSGFQFKKESGEISINNFGIGIDIISEMESMTFHRLKKDLSFSNTYAFDCVAPQIIYNDAVKSMEIFVKDTNDNRIIDVTSNFSGYIGKSREKQSIEKLLIELEEVEYYDKELKLEIVDTNTIPTNAIFIIKVHLTSGKELVKKSKKIKFI